MLEGLLGRKEKQMICFCGDEGVLSYLHGYRVHICDYHYNKWMSHSMEHKFDYEYKEDPVSHEKMMFEFARAWYKGEADDWEEESKNV